MVTIKAILTDFLIKLRVGFDTRYVKKNDLVSDNDTKQKIKDIIAEYNQENNIS